LILNRILLLGDSLTSGSGGRYRKNLGVYLAEQALGYGIRLRPYVIAKPGWTSSDLLSHLATVEWPDVREVVVWIGTNDAKESVPVDEFEENLEVLKAWFANKRLFFCTLPYLDGYGSQGYDIDDNEFIEEYNEVIRKNELVIEMPSVERPDGVHPDHEGYLQIARTIWDAVMSVRTFRR